MAKVYSLVEAQDAQLFEDACIAFGVFDGVHRGHREVIGHAVRQAQDAGLRSVVLTFDVDPDEVLRPDHVHKIMNNAQRLETLLGLGVDAVVTLPFSKTFAALEPLGFLERIFSGFPPFSLHVGSDFRFGCKGSGTVVDLVFWSERTGTQVVSYQLLKAGGEPITSTRIRRCLAEGDLQQANDLLGEPYVMQGLVEHGRAEGRDMGFRTANLSFDAACRLLAEGVYAGYAQVGEDRYKAAISFGVAPSFKEAQAECEVHLLGFDGDLYGQTVSVEFTKRLRPLIKFDDIDELIKTVMADINWCRTNL